MPSTGRNNHKGFYVSFKMSFKKRQRLILKAHLYPFHPSNCGILAQPDGVKSSLEPDSVDLQTKIAPQKGVCLLILRGKLCLFYLHQYEILVMSQSGTSLFYFSVTFWHGNYYTTGTLLLLHRLSK